MAILPLIILLVVIVVAWHLVVRGILWRLILLVGGPIAIWIVLGLYVPESRAVALTIGSTTVSWAAALPIALVILVLLTDHHKD